MEHGTVPAVPTAYHFRVYVPSAINPLPLDIGNRAHTALAPLPLPLGEVAERSEAGEGKTADRIRNEIRLKAGEIRTVPG